MDSLGIKPNYAQLARKYGMDWRTVKKYDLGYKGKPKTRAKPSKLDRYRLEIIDRLTIKRVTVRGVYEFMVAKYGLSCIGSYSNFIAFVKKNKLLPKSKDTGHPRYETESGRQAQVDWKEDISLTSRHGERCVINVFHYVLSFSRCNHLVLSIQRCTDDLFRCLIDCFRAMEGIPFEILFDNMPTIANVHGGRKKLTTSIQKFSKDFGFKVRTCGARKPETKGTVEAKNKVIDWIRAYDREFDTIDDLIEILKKINAQMNIEINEETGMSPVALFYKEKEYLHSLPNDSIIDNYLSPNRYKVSNEALIRYGNSRYSVDPKLIGEEVTVDVLGNKLYIYYNGKLIANHEINKKPLNYDDMHYKKLLEGKVDAADIETVANDNLKLMDKLLESRKVHVSNIEASRSPEALVAYINESPYGHWIIGQYAHMSEKERQIFITGMNAVLPYVKNKDAFMSRLKYSVKSNWCKQLDYDCWMNDCLEPDSILTEKGYELIGKKYADQIYETFQEMTETDGKLDGGDNEQL
jgi:transposase